MGSGVRFPEDKAVWMKYLLLYCLMALDGKGVQECYPVPEYIPTPLAVCLKDREEREQEVRPYKLVCWRQDDNW